MEPLSLLDLLSNGYLLLQTTPYLLPKELLALSRCSRSFHALVTESPSVWRHVDLSPSPSSAPTHAALGIRPQYQAHPAQLLRQPYVLRDVQTLVLDGLLSVTVQLLRDLLCSETPQYRIRLLSIRRCPGVDLEQLSVLFRLLARERRLGELRGCYLFGAIDSAVPPRLVQHKRGRFVDQPKLIDNDKTERDWVATLRECAAELVFDTRLCSGPRHSKSDHDHSHSHSHSSHDHSHSSHDHSYNHSNQDSHHADAPENPAPAAPAAPAADRIASVRLTGGCAVCHSSPEARLRRQAPAPAPAPVVIAPVPLTTSSLRAACSAPDRDGDSNDAHHDVLRCETCVANRMCDKCGKWWCEACVDSDQAADKKFVSLDCYDCGSLCRDCTAISSRTCSSCRGQYCVDHNDGADNEWVRLHPPYFVLPGQQRCVCPFWSNAWADGY